MNAILREYEAPVLTNEAIEVHLSYMRPGLDAVQVALPVLRDKIDELSAKMDSKFDQANRERAADDAALAEKIEQLDTKVDRLAAKTDEKFEKLEAKIDQQAARTDTKIEQLAARTDAKIEQLTERVLEMQGSQKGLKWFIGSVAVIAAVIGVGVSVAHTFGLI